MTMITPTTTTALALLLLLLTIHHVAHSLSSSSSTSSSTRISSTVVIQGANKYGPTNNSTILSPSDAAIAVGVAPTKKDATKTEWQRAWKIHRYLMKTILHRFDNCYPQDSKLSLACLWWKAISGNDVTSCVYDYSLSYDLLPPVTRTIVSGKLCRFYPRLHHANVEIRTAYLDKSIVNVINTILKEDHDDNEQQQLQNQQQQQNQQQKRKKIRLIVMGGGYDTRSIKLLEQSLLQGLDIDDDESSRSDDDYYYNLLRKKYNRHTTNATTQRRRRWYHRLLQRLRRSKIDTNNSNNNSSSNSLEDDTTTTTTIQTSPTNAFANITTSSNYYDIQSYELDLPEVVTAKRKLLLKRLYRRRPWLQKFARSHYSRSSSQKGVEEGGNGGSGGNGNEEYPVLIEANFNDLNGTRSLLEEIVLSNEDATIDDEDGGDDVTNIIVFEGVMIYLDEGIPHALLEVCSDVLRKSREQQQQKKKKKKKNTTNSKSKATPIGYLCFADRLENIPGGDEDAAQLEMESTGWELIDWLSKPGLARHMGVARVADSVAEES
jgi:hypothetical protein